MKIRRQPMNVQTREKKERINFAQCVLIHIIHFPNRICSIQLYLLLECICCRDFPPYKTKLAFHSWFLNCCCLLRFERQSVDYCFWCQMPINIVSFPDQGKIALCRHPHRVISPYLQQLSCWRPLAAPFPAVHF